MAKPGSSVALGPKRAFSRAENPSDRTPMPRLTGRNANPVPMAL